MNSIQKIVVLLAALLFLVLYLGFSTQKEKNNRPKANEARVVAEQALETIILDAKKRLSEQQNNQLRALEKLAGDATDTLEKNALLKKIAGFLFNAGQISASGAVAWQIAINEPSDSAWSVAGATFFEGIRVETDGKMRQFCAQKAVEAFENARQMNPGKVEHAVNQALVWAEVPPPDNPMKAALMLRELAEQHPQHPAPFNALGKLAIQTQQWQKAIERLEHSWSLQPGNPNTACMLALAYQKMGDVQKSKDFEKQCRQ